MFGTWWILINLQLASTGGCEVHAPREKGIALGLFSSDPGFSYEPMVREVAEHGATHLELAWVWWQKDKHAAEIAPRRGFSPTANQVVEAIRAAKQAGLHVTTFPIVRLTNGGASDWRGKIAPHDEDAWWTSYSEFILETALLAKHAGADRLSVGSELISRESQRERWLRLIERVRLRAGGLEILYSANWDHFRPVTFWDAVDVIGITGYFELTKDFDAPEDALVAGWAGPKREVQDWIASMGRPVVITEIGYPSLDGAAAWPWDETRDAPIDVDEQARAYSAFVRAWAGTPGIDGVYFWNWFGNGGVRDGNYTPRGKPAADVLKDWFRVGPRSNCGSSRLRP
ncbi:MAG: hypothetical protein HC923_05420 [Myxococcales bacterium]|nr:hypothetical protein [Myxococcales bacterium]